MCNMFFHKDSVYLCILCVLSTMYYLGLKLEFPHTLCLLRIVDLGF